MTTHKCNMALQCKSETCFHAKDHNPKETDCDRPAPCGSWPNSPDFQPHVICIPKEEVKPLEDCPHCGTKESKGHHYMDCIDNLKQQLADANNTNTGDTYSLATLRMMGAGYYDAIGFKKF